MNRVRAFEAERDRAEQKLNDAFGEAPAELRQAGLYCDTSFDPLTRRPLHSVDPNKLASISLVTFVLGDQFQCLIVNGLFDTWRRDVLTQAYEMGPCWVATVVGAKYLIENPVERTELAIPSKK